MTDKEIIKALEYCDMEYPPCRHCPYQICGLRDCKKNLIKGAKYLVKRQKSKIERLEMDKEQLEKDVSNALCNLGELELHYAYARTEAIKEVAEKLKAMLAKYDMYGILYIVEDIDNLVKERVGAEDE